MDEIITKYTPKGNFPLGLGSALRNPSYSYANWNIDEDETVLRICSDRAYHAEWQDGSEKQMDYVIEAAKTAGLGNCSGMLRELQAKTIFQALNLPRLQKLKRINYTEPGAGQSTVVLYKHLIDNGYDVERLFSTFVEPSEKRMSLAVDQLKKLGLKEGKNFVCIVGKDSELAFYLPKDSQHIIAANATLHHHAYIDAPFKLIYDLLALGGFFGNFEWFEGLCEHPARVYQALKNHNFKPPIIWETKEDDLQEYVRMFPKAFEEYPKFSPTDELATKQITTFWLDGWAVARAKAIEKGEFDPRDDYFMHEAHGRPQFQEKLLNNVGFRLDSRDVKMVMEAVGYNGNPHRVLTKEKMVELEIDKLYDDIPGEGSNLLMGFLSQKV